MNHFVRLTAIVLVTALSLAFVPRSGVAGAAATPTARNCYFLRNNLPCPCPRAQQARDVAHAANITARALGSAFKTTASALTRVNRIHGAPADPRNASQPTQPPKR